MTIVEKGRELFRKQLEIKQNEQIRAKELMGNFITNLGTHPNMEVIKLVGYNLSLKIKGVDLVLIEFDCRYYDGHYVDFTKASIMPHDQKFDLTSETVLENFSLRLFNLLEGRI